MQMIVPSLAFSLAVLARAAPTPDSTSSAASYPSDYPTRSDEFTIDFSVGSGDSRRFLTAVLENDGESDDFVLVGRNTDDYTGTPAYKNGTAYLGTALMFDLRDAYNNVNSLYGAFASNLGDQYGAWSAVYAAQKQEQFEWTVNQTVSHSLYTPSQSLLACNDTLNGEAVTLLAFGVRNEDDSAPPNCEFTEVIQSYDLPGGATPPQ